MSLRATFRSPQSSSARPASLRLGDPGVDAFEKAHLRLVVFAAVGHVDRRERHLAARRREPRRAGTLLEVEHRMLDDRRSGRERARDEQRDTGVALPAVPVCPVAFDVAQLERQLIERRLDFLKADDVRLFAGQPFEELRLSGADPVHVPRSNLHFCDYNPVAMNPGTRLGPYEVVGLLGAGGMGEVYRARDTRLQRDVAIKVLPASFAHDATLRARFERETQAVAALSHANILAIFDTGIHDDQLFAVTELLEGETLRDRLAGGALPVKVAMSTATQIARGLVAAHDKGLVHRDLKPENVFLVRSGEVKILDFGLATTSATSSHTTQTLAAMTEPGVVMGTVGYMSPEQLRGQAVDARTDLFALGAVLFEMLSGTRAFRGDTPADVATAVLRDELPDVVTPRGDLPPALDRIVRHCLERDPGERFQSARDIVFALETLSGSAPAPTMSATVAPSRPRSGVWMMAGAGIIAGALAALLITMAASRWTATPANPTTQPRPTPVVRTSINLPADTPLALGSRLMTVGFDNPALAISPDETYLSYISKSGQGTAVSLVELRTGRVRTLAGTEGATHSFFSPDSQQLGFLTGDRVKRVAVLGGATRTLCEAVRPTLGRWTADNTVYFSEEYGFAASRVAADGGRPERLLTLETGFVSDFLPDGKSILVSARLGINTDHARVMLVDLATGEGTTLVPSGFGARLVAREHLLFGRAGSLFAARFDASQARAELAVANKGSAKTDGLAEAWLGHGHL